MTEHFLKCLPHYYDAVERGDKNFEVRRDDRGFQRGDVLVLRCWSPEEGFWLSADPPVEIRRRITYVLTGGQFGVEPGYVVMGLEPCDAVEAEHQPDVGLQEATVEGLSSTIPGYLWHQSWFDSQGKPRWSPPKVEAGHQPSADFDEVAAELQESITNSEEVAIVAGISAWLLREAEAMSDGYSDDMYRSVAQRLLAGEHRRQPRVRELYCPVGARSCNDARCLAASACRQTAS